MKYSSGYYARPFRKLSFSIYIHFFIIGDETSKVVQINTRNTSTVVNTNKETENVNQLSEQDLNKIGRASAIAIMQSTNVCPFKFNGKFMCLFCPNQSESLPELAQHFESEHKLASAGEIRKAVVSTRKYNPIKINVLDFTCKLCNEEISNFEQLKRHLVDKHNKPVDPVNVGVWPFKVTNDEFSCVMCGDNFDDYRHLHKHVIFEHDTKSKNTIKGKYVKLFLITELGFPKYEIFIKIKGRRGCHFWSLKSFWQTIQIQLSCNSQS